MIATRLNERHYEACIEKLGLTDGEKVMLEYDCFWREPYHSFATGKLEERPHTGLLVFTSEHVIFMEPVRVSGILKKNYTATQVLRIPLGQVQGVSLGGTIIKHVVVRTEKGEQKFEYVRKKMRRTEAHLVVDEIQKLLHETREEAKRIAKQALSDKATPKMVYCRYCGTKNEAAASFCIGCNAPLE